MTVEGSEDDRGGGDGAGIAFDEKCSM